MLAVIGASMIAQAWRGFCANSAGLAELPPESASLWKRRPCWLTQIAGHQAEHEPAALRGIAVVGRGVSAQAE